MKNKYTCPMHPEVVSDTPGTCPKCHMKLVLSSSISSSVHKVEKNNYTPLIVVISLILLMTGSLSLKDSLMGTFSLSQTITYFMIGFFFVFSGFKLMDLKGFAEGYSTYDLIAKKWERKLQSITFAEPVLERYRNILLRKYSSYKKFDPILP